MATVGTLAACTTKADEVGSNTDAVRTGADRPGAVEAASCKANITFTPEAVNPAAPQVGTACAADVITALADACVEDPNGQPCAAARAANQTCAQCIFGAKTDPQWKVVNLMPGETPASRYNQEGCVDNVTHVSGCGTSYLTILSCFNDFCGQCSNADARACIEEVFDAECSAYRLTDVACVDALDANEVAVDRCFPTTQDAAGIKALFVNMATLACATPAPRSGDGG